MEMHPFLMKKKNISRAEKTKWKLTVSENNTKLRNTPRRKTGNKLRDTLGK